MQKQVIGGRALSPETDAFARRCAEFVSTTRPFFAGEEKRPLFAHARDSGYAWIFSVYLIAVFRYIPAYLQRSDVCGCCCLWSLSRRFIQATSRRLVYMHVRRYAPRSYSQRVNHQQVSILLRIRLPDTEYECSTMQSSVNCRTGMLKVTSFWTRSRIQCAVICNAHPLHACLCSTATHSPLEV